MDKTSAWNIIKQQNKNGKFIAQMKHKRVCFKKQ